MSSGTAMQQDLSNANAAGHRGAAGATPRRSLGDFTTDRRVLVLLAMSLVIGTGGTVAAWFLIQLIALVTNLAWFGRFDVTPTSLAHAARTPWMVLVPVVGGLIIGAMARFGSEKIRGHGIPE